MGFGWFDYATMVLYIGLMLCMGLWFMFRQQNSDDYFLGDRAFHWLPVAVSMFASLFSAVSYIAFPAEAFNHGMMFFLSSVFTLLGLPLAVVIFVRLFRRLSLTTAYEYLERRFDLRVRLLSSLLFLLLRSFYLGVVLFASAVALYPATGWPVWFSIVVVGVVATVYTTMGGIKSVIWTDVVQFVVLFGGILVVLGILAADVPGGLGGIWTHAAERGRTFEKLSDPTFYRFDPYARLSLWMMVVYAVFNKLGYSGADQISIQRYLSTRNERDAARSLVWGAVLSVPVVFLLFVTGLGLYYFYAMYPDKALPNMAGDHALAHFIATELPPGIGGIMLAAILAAVMSTVDSGLNSLATCTVTDFYARLWRPDASPRQKLRVAQCATLAWGGVSLLSAAAIVWLFGTMGARNPLVVVANVTLGFFTGILLGVFLLGTLTRRANGPGVLLGALVGLTTALAVTAPNYFVRLEPGTPRLSFLWINMIGCLATIITGYAFSFLFARPAADKLRGFTHWDPPAAGE